MLLEPIDISPLCKLVHYSRELVPVYHSWFQKYPELLELTASEPLSLEEELANQETWVNDPNKITFIIIDSDDRPCGDVNCFLNEDVGELNVMIAEPGSRRKGLAKAAVRAMVDSVKRQCPEVRRFVAKIDKDNTPSRAMFEGLGFALTRTIGVFNEVHYEQEIH